MKNSPTLNSDINVMALLTCTVVLLGLIGSVSVSALFAQKVDYGPQIEAFKQSFNKKSIKPVKKYLSEDLTFFTYPASATLPILKQVVSKLPALKSIKITGTRQGEVSIVYNFTALGKRESKILFNGDGLITKIELIDNLLEEQQKAQKALKSSVQEPDPGALAKKFTSQKITFPSQDGLTVTGNLYEVNREAPVILLCHQANYNKYEYADIAPKLNAMGYNVLAIDQRSGGSFASHANETFQRAKAEGLSTGFLDAEQDIAAAVAYLADEYSRKITVWGSSYSASLVLYLAKGNENINAAIAFSPGNYFGDKKPPLQEILGVFNKPFFITSSKDESNELKDIVGHLKLENKQIHFIPQSNGYHGSRVLWEGQKGSAEYWEAISRFLSKVYPNH